MTLADGSGQAPRLVRIGLRGLLLAPVRVGLAIALVGAALLAGVELRVALLASGVAAFGSFLLLLSDRRALLLRAGSEPMPLPQDARIASAWETIRNGVFPSTVGVAVLALAALAFNEVLAAFMAGILAGMGLAGLVSGLQLAARERDEGVTLYAARRGVTLYAGRAGQAGDGLRASTE
jgi:hypothetical protein